jgi:hypothetical protein
MRFDESEIIGACALRLDGYRYLEAHPFDVDESLEYFFRTGGWNISPLEQMAVFFIIQRALRQPLEYEPKNGRYYRVYRTLFLSLCREDVPEEYRHPHCYREWKGGHERQLPKYVRRVEAIHKEHRQPIVE